jgi:Zn-dependent protease
VAWKLKALIFGLTKLTTLLSMFAFFGVYWSLYGWALALGLVISIYVHEMGHVIALRGYGLPASAPMFIPGLGAFIRLKSSAITPVQDARIGLEGPMYGLGAALLSLCAYVITGAKIWAAIAHIGAVINLFNLIPIWQLDGSRGFHSLTRSQRTIVLACAVVAWLITQEPMLLLIAIGAGYRLFLKDAAPEPDNTGLIHFAGLIAALATLVAVARLT